MILFIKTAVSAELKTKYTREGPPKEKSILTPAVIETSLKDR